MLNGWLLYQTVACRIWAPSALHQSDVEAVCRDHLQAGPGTAPQLLSVAAEASAWQRLFDATWKLQPGFVLTWSDPDCPFTQSSLVTPSSTAAVPGADG